MLHEEQRVNHLRLFAVDGDPALGEPVAIDHAEVLEEFGAERVSPDPARQSPQAVQILEHDHGARLQAAHVQFVLLLRSFEHPAGQLRRLRREQGLGLLDIARCRGQLVDIHGHRVPAGTRDLGVHRVPLGHANRGTGKAVPVPPETLSISLPIRAAPAYCVADHLWDHPVPIVDDRDLVRLDAAPGRGSEAKSDRHSVGCRLERVVDLLRERPRRVLVPEIAHAPKEGVGEHYAETVPLPPLFRDVLPLPVDGLHRHRDAVLVEHILFSLSSPMLGSRWMWMDWALRRPTPPGPSRQRQNRGLALRR
jgi:hypothetical protein